MTVSTFKIKDFTSYYQIAFNSEVSLPSDLCEARFNASICNKTITLQLNTIKGNSITYTFSHVKHCHLDKIKMLNKLTFSHEKHPCLIIKATQI